MESNPVVARFMRYFQAVGIRRPDSVDIDAMKHELRFRCQGRLKTDPFAPVEN